VRWAVLDQAFVVFISAFPPATRSVVASLLGQHGCFFRVEVDLALSVRVALGLIQNAHDYEGRRCGFGRLPPSAVPSVNVNSPTGVPDDDAYWQRPDPDSGTPDPAPLPAPEPDPAENYSGPPRPSAANPYWRPPTVAEPPPPRSMPPQDMDALDDAEGSARTVTYGVGLVAGAIVVILMCLLCARAIF
jgi:hypothetical protein